MNDITGDAEVIAHLEAKETPDVVCTAIGLCSGVCRLFPAPSEGTDASAIHSLPSQPMMQYFTPHVGVPC